MTQLAYFTNWVIGYMRASTWFAPIQNRIPKTKIIRHTDCTFLLLSTTFRALVHIRKFFGEVQGNSIWNAIGGGTLTTGKK